MQGETTHLATIQQLDPIYADFTQSVTEMNQLRRAVRKRRARTDRARRRQGAARARRRRGSIPTGKLLFSEATVDACTGQVTLRGEFPNPKRELLPGMYVRVQIEQGIDPDALAVPQQAIHRNDAGGSEVFVVSDDNRAAIAAGPHRPRVEDGMAGQRAA